MVPPTVARRAGRLSGRRLVRCPGQRGASLDEAQDGPHGEPRNGEAEDHEGAADQVTGLQLVSGHHNQYGGRQSASDESA